MTQEQKDFIKTLLGQITVNASDPKASETIQMIQSILQTLDNKE